MQIHQTHLGTLMVFFGGDRIEKGISQENSSLSHIHMVALMNKIYQTSQPSSARMVQGGPNTQEKDKKTKCGSNKVAQRGWPEERRKQTGGRQGTD